MQQPPRIKGNQKGEWKVIYFRIQTGWEKKKSAKALNIYKSSLGPKGMNWSCVKGQTGWLLGKCSSAKGGGNGTDSPWQWSLNQAARIPEPFGKQS